MSPVAILRPWHTESGLHGQRLFLWCPACNDAHSVEVGPRTAEPRWTWDGNLDAPTLSPSIKVLPTAVSPLCHSFVRCGSWEFLADSGHSQAGQTVPLPPLPEWMAVYAGSSQGGEGE